MTSAAPRREEVMEAIASVKDPCSVLIGSHLSLSVLGMISSVEIDGPRVRVELLLDDPLCMYLFPIHHGIRDAVQQVAGVEEVEVSLNGREVWTPDRLKAGWKGIRGKMESDAETSIGDSEPAAVDQ